MALSQSREQLLNSFPEAFLKSIKDSVLVVDRSFRIVWANGRWGGRLLADPDSLLGRRCHVVIQQRQSPCPEVCPVAPVFATGRPQVLERNWRDEQGREMWGENRAYPILGQDGRVLLAVKIAFDITQRKKDQAQRDGYLERLEGALRGAPALEAPAPQLTPRQAEVLRLVAQGLSNREIAGVLGLSPHTIKSHLVHIFDKLEVNDRTQAAVWAARLDLA
jgi:PAS domain S-box-containing protein